MNHQLRRPGGRSFDVDADVWLCALDLALAQGWRPSGFELDSSDRRAFDYVSPRGQEVVEFDARELGRCLEAGLGAVPDRQVPMGGHAFGEDNTADLLQLAASGMSLPDESDRAAREILSGEPRHEALALAQFLSQGGFTLH